MAAHHRAVATALRAIARDLAALDVPWALVGGLAVSARVEPRLTRDVDAVVAAGSDDRAEQVIFDLQTRGYRVRSVLAHRRGRMATVRLVHERRPEVLVDLLFASSGIEREIAAAAETLAVLPRFRVPVARVGDLIAMKLLARDDRRRPQDADDLWRLLVIADASDLARARKAIAWIAARGFARRRNLVGALARAQREVERGAGRP